MCGVFVSNLRNDERFVGGDNSATSLSQMCVPLCPEADEEGGDSSAPAVVLKLVNRKEANGAAAALPFDRADVKRVVEIFGGLLLKQLAAVDYDALGVCDLEGGGAADKPITCTIVPEGADDCGTTNDGPQIVLP